MEFLIRFCLQKNFYTKNGLKTPARQRRNRVNHKGQRTDECPPMAAVGVHFRRTLRALIASHTQPGKERHRLGLEELPGGGSGLAGVPSAVQGGIADASQQGCRGCQGRGRRRRWRPPKCDRQPLSPGPCLLQPPLLPRPSKPQQRSVLSPALLVPFPH